MGSSSATFELSCTRSKHDVIGRHHWFLPRHDEPPHFLQLEVSGGTGDALASEDDARLFSSRVRCHGDDYSPTGLSWWISDPNVSSSEWDCSQSEVPSPLSRFSVVFGRLKMCIRWTEKADGGFPPNNTTLHDIQWTSSCYRADLTLVSYNSKFHPCVIDLLTSEGRKSFLAFAVKFTISLVFIMKWNIKAFIGLLNVSFSLNTQHLSLLLNGRKRAEGVSRSHVYYFLFVLVVTRSGDLFMCQPLVSFILKKKAFKVKWLSNSDWGLLVNIYSELKLTQIKLLDLVVFTLVIKTGKLDWNTSEFCGFWELSVVVIFAISTRSTLSVTFLGKWADAAQMHLAGIVTFRSLLSLPN